LIYVKTSLNIQDDLEKIQRNSDTEKICLFVYL